jgi:hypothetical protein
MKHLPAAYSRRFGLAAKVPSFERDEARRDRLGCRV